MTYGEQAGRSRGRRGSLIPDAGDRAGPGGLVARTAEVLAMSVSGGVDAAADPLADLAADLAGPRGGPAEAEAVSRRVLAGMT